MLYPDLHYGHNKIVVHLRHRHDTIKYAVPALVVLNLSNMPALYTSPLPTCLRNISRPPCLRQPCDRSRKSPAI